MDALAADGGAAAKVTTLPPPSMPTPLLAPLPKTMVGIAADGLRAFQIDQAAVPDGGAAAAGDAARDAQRGGVNDQAARVAEGTNALSRVHGNYAHRADGGAVRTAGHAAGLPLPATQFAQLASAFQLPLAVLGATGRAGRRSQRADSARGCQRHGRAGKDGWSCAWTSGSGRWAHCGEPPLVNH